MRALIIEDDQTIADFVARGLREAGFAVDMAADGDGGLELASSEPYDVAQQGFEALMKGEKHVYSASLATKVEGAVANFVPDSVKAAMHEKMSKPA